MFKILLPSLLFILLSCGDSKSKDQKEKEQVKTPKKEIGGWKTYSSNDYSIQYPPEWKINQSGTMNTNLILLAPSDSDSDHFKENVNLMIQNLKGRNMNLDQFVKISEDQIKNAGSQFTLIENNKIKNGDTEYQRLLYTGSQSSLKLKFEQYVWLQNENAYVLTLSTEESTFDKYKKDGENILNSFAFKK